MAFGLSATSTPWLVTQHFRASEAILGSIAAGGTLFYTVLALCAGVLAKRAKPQLLGAMGALAVAFAYTSIAYTPSIVAMALSLWLSSTGLALFWPSLQTRLCGGVSPDELRKRVARFNFSWSAGLTTGPLLAGQLYPHSRSLPFLTAGSAAMVVVLLIVTGKGHQSPAAPAGIPGGGIPGEGVPAPAALSAPSLTPGISLAPGASLLAAAWCANFASYFAGANVRNFYPVLATTRHISVQTQGLLLFGLGLVQTAAFRGLEYWGGWRSTRVAYYVPLAMVAAAMLLLTASASPAVHLAAFAVSGVGTCVLYSLSLFHSLNSPHQSRNSGIHEGIIGGSGLFGALIGGFIGSAHGVASPFYLSAAIVAAGFVPVAWLLHRDLSLRGSQPGVRSSPAPRSSADPMAERAGSLGGAAAGHAAEGVDSQPGHADPDRGAGREWPDDAAGGRAVDL